MSEAPLFDRLALIGAGLIGGTGQLLLTEALRRAPVAVVAPFDYSQLIWAGIIGYLVWDEIPRAATIAGALVVTVYHAALEVLGRVGPFVTLAERLAG